MKTVIISLTIALLLGACELVIDVDPPDFKSSIVFNSILQPDSSIEVTLGQDYYILDNEIDNYGLNGLTGAQINVFEDGTEIGTMSEFVYTTDWGEKFTGYYELDYQPKAGSEYTFEISKSGFTAAQVSERLPVLLPKVDLTIKDTVQDEWGGDQIKVGMKIEDLPGDNYYELVVYENGYSEYYDDAKDSLIRVPVRYEVYISSQNLLVAEYQQKFLFSDELFKDTSYELEFEFYSYNYGYPDGVDEEGNELKSYLMYQIRACSKAYYQYYNSAALHFWNSDNPFAEPVHVYTNVENGYGVLGSFTAVTDTLGVY